MGLPGPESRSERPSWCSGRMGARPWSRSTSLPQRFETSAKKGPNIPMEPFWTTAARCGCRLLLPRQLSGHAFARDGYSWLAQTEELFRSNSYDAPIFHRRAHMHFQRAPPNFNTFRLRSSRQIKSRANMNSLQELKERIFILMNKTRRRLLRGSRFQECRGAAQPLRGRTASLASVWPPVGTSGTSALATAPMPSFLRNSASILEKMSLFSLRKVRVFSRPWPMRSPE